MRHFVIAIDGPAGAGKGTVAKLAAERLGFLYVDTGAMYRALTLKALRKGLDLEDESALAGMARSTDLQLYPRPGGCGVRLDGQDVSEDIRTEEVSRNSHYIASTYAIREIMWEMQRRYRETSDLVMEGRDIGSIVFPDAQLKIYLDASVAERAARRYRQLQEKGQPADIQEIEKDITARDEKDRNRSIAPLLRLPDAVYIDSTSMTIAAEVDEIVRLYHERVPTQTRES